MKKWKVMSFVAMVGSGLLLSGGCGLGDGLWPWVVGVGLLGLLGLGGVAT